MKEFKILSMDKLTELLNKYKGFRTDLMERLDELSKKGLWDIYHDKEIHLRYIDTLIEDLEEILNDNSVPKAITP